jgi:hypothetical protein
MNRLGVPMLLIALTFSMAGFGQAGGDKNAQAVIDKGIAALGGAEKLGAVKAATWKAKGKVNFGGNENEFTSAVTVQGLDHYRSEFESDFGGNKFKGVTVLAGKKGWRKFGDNRTDLEGDGLANEKRNVYLQVVPMTLVPLKGKDFKVESAAAEKVADKAASVLKVTAPDGKDFKLYLDQASSQPVKLVASVVGFNGQEFMQETNFGNYKDFQGIKKATKIEIKRDGEVFMTQEITDFRTIDKVDPKTFSEPE